MYTYVSDPQYLVFCFETYVPIENKSIFENQLKALLCADESKHVLEYDSESKTTSDAVFSIKGVSNTSTHMDIVVIVIKANDNDHAKKILKSLPKLPAYHGFPEIPMIPADDSRIHFLNIYTLREMKGYPALGLYERLENLDLHTKLNIAYASYRVKRSDVKSFT